MSSTIEGGNVLARNDDGEFELILGNRQLITVFLIIVIMLAVFFSMGYIVGRNSAPVVVDARNATPAKTAATDNVAAHPGSPGATDTTAAQTPASTPETKPAEAPPQEAKKPEPAVEETPKAAAAPPPAPRTEAKPQKPAGGGGVRSLDEPPAGSYWQVVATTRPEAEIVAEAIAKKGLRCIITPAPKAGLFRVLVGPLANASAMGQARADLEAAGFKSVIPKKY